nr:AAA family ATPase [Clostridia bacterium]
DSAKKERMRLTRVFKGSRAFIALLDRLVEELPRGWIPFADVEYDGKCVASAELSRTSVCNANKTAPLGKRLRALEKDIWRRIRILRPRRQEKLLEFANRFPEHAMETKAFARMLSIRESGRIREQIRAFTRVDCVKAYRALFADRAAFERLTSGLLPREEAEIVRLSTWAQLGALELEMAYEDAVAIAYLQARVDGSRAYANLRQVVVDEVQDLDVLHAALMGLLFPNARFTLLGDVHQTLAGRADPSFYRQTQAVLGKPNSLLVSLDKSFRCTREIWAFSERFLPPGTAGFSRSGEEPVIHGAADEGTIYALLEEQTRACRQKGCESIAVLCKTQRDARRLYERLKDRMNVTLLGQNDSVRGGELTIASLFMAKGLEFDAVFIWDADASRYREEADKQLLYIGCTRALHILQLFHLGERSPLLPADGEGIE